MATKDMVGYIGVVDVTPASGNVPASGLEVQLRCNVQDTRNTGSVNCVVLRPKIKFNWMCYL